MMAPSLALLVAGLALSAPPAGPVPVWSRELATVESAAEVLQALTVVPFPAIPRALLQDAQGLAIIPGVIKAGFVVGGRHGHGVVLVRNPDGSWGNPVFVTLTGGSIGWQIGVQSADIVLVFKTRNSLDRILQGRSKLTLGGDVAVAAGPVGRQAEAGTDGRLQAEIYSYARSRGLFAGLSLEGAGLWADHAADAAFYGIPGGRPADVQALRSAPPPAEALKAQVAGLTSSPAPPPVAYPPRLAPIPVPPASAPPPGLPRAPVPVVPPPPPPPGPG